MGLDKALLMSSGTVGLCLQLEKHFVCLGFR